MGLFRPKFKDITMKDGTLEAKIFLSRFGGRFGEAQEWLDRAVVERMTPFIPYKTGEFRGKILNENARTCGSGKVTVAVPPQGHVLYPGISPSGKPYNWTNPNTQPRWGSYTVEAYKPELMRGVRDIILGKRGKT